MLTDGQTPKGRYAQLVRQMQDLDITTTGVAVGPDADRQLLNMISQRGGGKFYHVRSPKAIPKIFMEEARRVAMPVVFEDKNGISMGTVSRDEMLSGIEDPIPPVTSYALTIIKQDPLVEVLLATPRQPPENSTLLATRQHGLGRTVALTTDVGQRWATAWQQWGDYEQLMLQMVRWSMRSHDLHDRLTMSAEVRNGAIEVVVNALDQDDADLNWLSLFSTAFQPNGESRDFSLEQVAPGRYLAKLPADEPGSYYLSVSGGGRTGSLQAAISVAQTAELDLLQSRDDFLAELAEGTPKDGEPGLLIRAPGGLADTQGLLDTDVFRPGIAPAITRDRVWPLVLLLASVAFLSDVFCRRVQVSFDWLPPLVNRWLIRRRVATVEAPQMERLKATKASASTRFAVAGTAASYEPSAFEAASSAVAAPPPESQPEAVETQTFEAPQQSEPQEFTARLLEAKRRLREK